MFFSSLRSREFDLYDWFSVMLVSVRGATTLWTCSWCHADDLGNSTRALIMSWHYYYYCLGSRSLVWLQFASSCLSGKCVYGYGSRVIVIYLLTVGHGWLIDLATLLGLCRVRFAIETPTGLVVVR